MQLTVKAFALDPQPKVFSIDKTNVTFGAVSFPLKSIEQVTWYTTVTENNARKESTNFTIKLKNNTGKEMVITMQAIALNPAIEEEMSNNYTLITGALMEHIVLPRVKIALKNIKRGESVYIAPLTITKTHISYPSKSVMLLKRLVRLPLQEVAFAQNDNELVIMLQGETKLALSAADTWNLPLLQTLLSALKNGVDKAQ